MVNTVDSTPQTPTLDTLRHGRIMVAGAGVAGQGVIAMLGALHRADGAQGSVVIVDDASPRAHLTVSQAIELFAADSGGHGIALVITSPGWRPDSPLFAAAAAAGVPIIGDIEAAWVADREGAFGPSKTWLAVTGTNGKTTTTAMLNQMCLADGRSCAAVGNIGKPPGTALAEDAPERRIDALAAEVSSFQLHWAENFAPTAGCVLNLAEDHLDWHGSFAGYAADKMVALRGEHAVLPADEAEVLAFALPGGGPAEWLAPRVHAFSTADPRVVLEGPVSQEISLESVVGVAEGRLTEWRRWEGPTGTGGTDAEETPEEGESLAEAAGAQWLCTDLAPAAGISPAGPAGLADAAAAAALARCIGVAPASIAEALSTFRVQAHRGQVVARIHGVDWVDNSKATNPHAARAALAGQRNVVWVAGGQLKGASVAELIAEIGPALRGAVALGADRDDICADLNRLAPDIPVVRVNETDPHRAMETVVRAAHDMSRAGDRVILAPAAASLDMYTGMGQRGDLFAHYANNLAAKDLAAEDRPQSQPHHNATTPTPRQKG
ncbi:Mur ligase family protein [Corynebacterium heidelbergense]|uniref:UDP-N-acetylmuramoylalanine--D-glutamate ligase n=1 Tax=Corynebacterium heidelbergense TaxID=2055947 RepID=A0A364VBR2_9CORY|nr:Mur ligase family protein [Corynebacterium heidelbergense]RAV34077.1 UDP-N-acetylmuramoyl-L-alanine--D-glutamate ligase [Corynebacterium heidelbergense]